MALRHRRITNWRKYDLKHFGYSLIHQNPDGSEKQRDYIKVPPVHTVRTLNSVGGKRGRAVHSMRRLNAFARKLGYSKWAEYMEGMRLERSLFDNLQMIGASVTPPLMAA